MSQSFARVGINAHLASTSATYRAAGTSRYVSSLLEELARLGPPERFDVYLSRRHVPPALGVSPRLTLHASRLPTWRPAVRILWEQLLWPALLARDHVQVAHGPAHAIPLGWGGRTVVTILDLSFLIDPSTFRSANQRYLSAMVKLAVRRATRIIAISEWTKHDVVRLLGARPNQVDVVPLGVDARFRPVESQAVDAFRSAHGLQQPFILFLGTVEPRKNLIRLLDAYVELRKRGRTECPLIIAGGLGPGANAVLTHCEALQLGRAVQFVGFVPEEEKPLWYNSARLFAFPSQYEGFGLPVLEAFACGTPVVTSNQSSLPEVAGHAGIQVDPFDVLALADAMQRVMEDEALRQQLVAAGLEQAKRFSWTAAAEKTLAVYRSAFGEHQNLP